MPGRLLLVDDEDTVIFAMTVYFQVSGYEVETASSAEQATAKLQDGDYAAVLLDLRLSTAQPAAGLEVARIAVRRRPRPRVVILTAYGSAAAEAEASRLGVDAFLHKPQPLPFIAEVLESLIRG